MKATGHIRFSTAGLRFAAAVGCLVFVLTVFPQRGFSQCEPQPTADAAQSSLISGETSDVNTLINKVISAWRNDVLTLSTDLYNGVSGTSGNKGSYTGIMARINTFWNDWFKAWQNMAAQLNASTDDETRQLSSFKDASDALAASRDEAEQRIRAQKLYQPTGQACLFDTTNRLITPAKQITSALEDAYEWDFVQLGNNEAVYPNADPNLPATPYPGSGNGSYSPQDSTGQFGPAEEQSRRWYNYSHIFCDYRAENGNAGCDPGTVTLPSPYPLKVGYGPTLQNKNYPPYAILQPTDTTRNDKSLMVYANMDVEPTLLLFSQYTVDLYNTTELTAVDQMMFNITGYKIPMPIVSDALTSVPGMEETLKRRQYMAQMSTINALLYTLIADRAPGPGGSNSGGSNPSANAQELYGLRTKEYGATPNKLTDATISTAATCGFLNFACYIGKLWNELWNGSISTQFLGSQQKTPPVDFLEASITPSQREIRQAIIEQLWDPNYYKDLYNHPSTILQKDVYLKAYSLSLIYEKIERQERISDVYAVETANLLAGEKSALDAMATSGPMK